MFPRLHCLTEKRSIESFFSTLTAFSLGGTFLSLLPWGESGHRKTIQVSESLNYFSSAIVSYVLLLYGTCTWYSGTALKTSRGILLKWCFHVSVVERKKGPSSHFSLRSLPFQWGETFFISAPLRRKWSKIISKLMKHQKMNSMWNSTYFIWLSLGQALTNPTAGQPEIIFA